MLCYLGLTNSKQGFGDWRVVDGRRLSGFALGSWLGGSKSYLVEIRRYGWLEHTSVSMLMKIKTSFA